MYVKRLGEPPQSILMRVSEKKGRNRFYKKNN